MTFPIFLSVVVVLRNESPNIERLLLDFGSCISPMVNDYELIIVDNASEDDSVAVLKRLTSEDGIPNLQIYALTKEVDLDTAAWVGIESSLGDYVVGINPLTDDITILPRMLERSVSGVDVVMAYNLQKSSQGFIYNFVRRVFNGLFKWFNDISIDQEVTQYHIFSKQVVNFLLRYPQPQTTYRHLTATAGFVREGLTYSMAPKISQKKSVMESIDRGIWLLASTTKAPMRIVTLLSFFGAVTNLVYFVYILGVSIWVVNIAPGWVTLSLQQSGMFFLISAVLFVLGEYILVMARLSNEGPPYHVSREFTSARMIRRDRLNVEEVAPGDASLLDKNSANLG